MLRGWPVEGGTKHHACERRELDQSGAAEMGDRDGAGRSGRGGSKGPTFKRKGDPITYRSEAVLLCMGCPSPAGAGS